MEIYNLEKDISVFCITADSFPAGIQNAYDALYAKLPTKDGRKFFGLSWAIENGSIIYKAAVEESYDGEAEKLGCERFTIKKGKYISEFIPDYMKDVQGIGRIFKALLAQPGIDPKGYCLEIYAGAKDVWCMVPLAE
jgi:hypothetical protein